MARTARKVLLGREIDAMIRRARMTQAEAGKLIKVSQSRIASVLAGTGNLTPDALKALAHGLGVTDPDYIDTLLELHRDNHKRGFWTTGYRRAYIEELRLLVDLEDKADRLRETGAEIIPGLLQHPNYIRALHESLQLDTTDPDAVTVEDYVEARLARQQNLTKTCPPEFHAILSESCLRRSYGGDAVMLEQVNHLIEVSWRPNIILQVMPFTHQAPGAGMEDRYILIRVPSPGAAGDLEMAVVEAQGEIRYIDEKPAIAIREKIFARLSATALSEADSRQFMEHIARGLRGRPTIRQ
ncbi:helix-turn-helix domain-containing protein [Nocardia gipuzkoensis]|uniref:helix-turn-helix domain-containing protein n=1 Tax=Nocardia gipuzkoensis TaxID=2749991 RepID=UPI00237ED7D7|nr:helix-turn-helix transcriptional regulator [Nocardia gipuzkoensis]MDE1674744.1 helix-turn-helix transcriptional regulator [Nocardia gipuzkoensis]